MPRAAGCQSGWDAAEERVDKAPAKCVDSHEVCPTMCPTRSLNCVEEAMKAAGAWKEASHKFRPPATAWKRYF